MERRRELRIGSTTISDATEAYVVAEIGHNHQGSLTQCKELFRQAKAAGANAVKLQKRDNRTLFTRAMYDSPYDNENSFGRTYGEHREALELGRDSYVELKELAFALGLDFFATAFDFKSADFLADLDMPAFKIASADLTNTPLLEHIARFGKPMIVSTGGGTMADVERAYQTIMPIHGELAILQCTAAYPVQPEDMNLRVIESFRDAFETTVIGLSDHQNGIAMALVAYVLGARIFEKHFTLNRSMKGTDHAFSLEPAGLTKLVRDLRRAHVAMGDGVKRRLDIETKPLLKMAKKLVAARAMPAGHRLERRDLALKSPGDGLLPYHLGRVLGKRLVSGVEEDDPIVLDGLADD